MADDQPGDVRDTLSELERRLRELEGDLRSGGSQQGAEAPATDPPMANADASAVGGDGTRHPSGTLIAAIATAALLAAVLIVILVSSGSDTPSTAPGASQIAIGAGLDGSDPAEGLAKLDGVRGARGDAAAEACVGTAAAALVIVQPKPTTVGCAGLQTLLTLTVSATRLAERGGRQRCLRASQVAAQSSGPSNGLSHQRAARIDAAAGQATAAAAARKSSPAASIGAQRAAAAKAGSKFDRSHRLSLAEIRDASGSCIAPTAATLRSGSYPLSLRIALLARPDSASSANVKAASQALRKVLNGPVPVSAVVRGR